MCPNPAKPQPTSQTEPARIVARDLILKEMILPNCQPMPANPISENQRERYMQINDDKQLPMLKEIEEMRMISESMYKERTKEIMEIVKCKTSRASCLSRRCHRCRPDLERSLKGLRLLKFPFPRPRRQRAIGRGCGMSRP